MQRKMTKATNWISEWEGEVWSERTKTRPLHGLWKKRKKKAMNSPEKKSEKLVTALCSMSLNGISTPTLRRVSGM